MNVPCPGAGLRRPPAARGRAARQLHARVRGQSKKTVPNARGGRRNLPWRPGPGPGGLALRSPVRGPADRAGPWAGTQPTRAPKPHHKCVASGLRLRGQPGPLTSAHQLRATPQPCANECSISRRRHAASHGRGRQQRPSVCMRLLGGTPDTPSPSAPRPHESAPGPADGPWTAIPSGVQPVGRRAGTSFGGQASHPGSQAVPHLQSFTT